LSRDGEIPSLKVFGVWKIYKSDEEEKYSNPARSILKLLIINFLSISG